MGQDAIGEFDRMFSSVNEKVFAFSISQILQIYMWAAFVKLEQDWLDGSALATTMVS